MLLGGAVIGAIGVAAIFPLIGVCYAAVTTYGFFNPAFRELDRSRASESGELLPGNT